MAILINLNDARKKLNELEGSSEYNNGVADAFNALFDLPTVNAEPVKHGRWIYTDYGGIGNWHCSECHNIVLGVNGFPNLTNYCQNCGAIMNKEE